MEIQNAPYPCSDLEWHLEDEIAEPQNLSQAQVFQHCVSLNIWFLLHNFSFVHICVSTVHHNITFYGLEYFQYVKCRTNRKLSNDKDMVETDIEEVEPGAVFEDKKVQNSRSCRPSLITRHYTLDIILFSLAAHGGLKRKEKDKARDKSIVFIARGRAHNSFPPLWVSECPRQCPVVKNTAPALFQLFTFLSTKCYAGLDGWCPSCICVFSHLPLLTDMGGEEDVYPDFK